MELMDNKICLVTGATNGIGYQTALALARMGATVIVVGRNKAKGEAVVAAIQQKTGNKAVESMTADLSSMAEVRRLAQEFKAKYQKLHVLINNAGAIFFGRQTSVDGYEMTFALNHLSYFLLTQLLLNVLKTSAPSRIVNVSSDAHRSYIPKSGIDFDNLQGEKRYLGIAAYSQSKLANILFTYELARRLEGTGITANVLHPGLVQSGFAKNTNNVIIKAVFTLMQGIAGMNAEKGAQTSVYVATAPELEGVSGKYFDKKKMAKSSQLSYDQAVWARLWEVTEQLTASITT